MMTQLSVHLLRQMWDEGWGLSCLTFVGALTLECQGGLFNSGILILGRVIQRCLSVHYVV